MMFISKIRWGLACMFALGGLSSYSTCSAVQDLANGWGPAPAEIARLPMYCQKQFTAGKDAPRVVATLSPGCDGVHHYCAGLVLANRANNFLIPKDERRRILEGANREVDYFTQRPNASCLRTRMQEAHMTQQRLKSMAIVLH